MKIRDSGTKQTSVNKTAFYNMLSVVMLQGIAFITAPIFTRMLGPGQYGNYSVFNAWVSVVTCFMGLNVGNSIGPGLYTFKDDYLRFRNSIFLLGLLISMILVGVLILFRNQISKLISYPPLTVILIACLAMSTYITNFIQTALIFEKRAGVNLIISVLVSITTTALSLILVANFPNNEKYFGRIYGVSIPHIIIAIVIGVIFYMSKVVGYEKKYWTFALIMGIPIVFHSLSQKVLTQSDRIMMQYIVTDEADIGIYSAFYSLSSVLSTILSALNTSWVPFYYDDLAGGKVDILNKKSRNYIELLTVLICGFILLCKEVGFYYASGDYYRGIGVLPILAISVFFMFMYQFAVNFEMFFKETKVVAIGTVGAALCNIVLNWLFIPIWSLYGAAFATAISYGVLFLFHYFNIMFRMPQRFHLNIRIFIPSIVAIIVCITAFYLISNMWYLRWLFAVIIGLIEICRIIKRKSIF